MNRYLATLRSILAFAVADGRIPSNPASGVKPPSGAHTRREGSFLTLDELHALQNACERPYADLVLFLGLTGLRWGEAAGVQVGDVITLPGPGLRLQRAVLSSCSDGHAVRRLPREQAVAHRAAGARARSARHPLGRPPASSAPFRPLTWGFAWSR